MKSETKKTIGDIASTTFVGAKPEIYEFGPDPPFFGLNSGKERGEDGRAAMEFYAGVWFTGGG